MASGQLQLPRRTIYPIRQPPNSFVRVRGSPCAGASSKCEDLADTSWPFVGGDQSRFPCAALSSTSLGRLVRRSKWSRICFDFVPAMSSCQTCRCLHFMRCFLLGRRRTGLTRRFVFQSVDGNATRLLCPSGGRERTGRFWQMTYGKRTFEFRRCRSQGISVLKENVA